jgi:hypothetical protein
MYVVAYDRYYPCGGFNDVKFEGSREDCEEVAAKLEGQYDHVSVVDPYINTCKESVGYY